MLKFKETNVNPKGRKTGDCSTRALCNVLGISYDEVIDKQAYWAKKKCYGLTCKQTMELVLKEYGYVKIKQPRKANGRKYEVREMDQVLSQKQMEEGVFITVANHHTTIKHGVIEDTWNCGNSCVGNYYIKNE